MSSDQRHGSQMPGMEEKNDDLAAMLKKHGNNILLFIILVVLVLVSWTWLKDSQKAKEMEKQQAMAKVLVSRGQAQVKALESSDDESLLGGNDYQPKAEINQLRELAAKEAGTSIGCNAMIQQAITIMSQLYLGKDYVTSDKKAEICKEAEDIYNSVVSKYPENITAVSQAKLGLAAIACEIKDWEKATELYASLLAEKDVLSSTVFPAMAQAGLDKIEDLKEIEDIEFPLAPEPEENLEDLAAPEGEPTDVDSQDDSAADTDTDTIVENEVIPVEQQEAETTE